MSRLPIVDSLVDVPLPPETKGWRADGAAVSSASVRASSPGLFDGRITFPVAVIDEDALLHNIAVMADFCSSRGVLLAPHGKTTMSPQIAAAQLAAGAWAITAATVQQAMAYHRHGVSRVLIANQVTDVADLDWLAQKVNDDAGFEPIICVDSLTAVELADRRMSLGSPNRPLKVLVELGHPGGRTGARTVDDALEIARAAHAAQGLEPIGVTAYEGTLGHDGSPEEGDRVRAFCTTLVGLGAQLADEGVLAPDHVVSAGGSLFFTEVCEALTAAAGGPIRPVLRSGAYVIHDHGHYEEVTPASRGFADAPTLRATTTLWAPVLSVPETGMALLLLGRRDVGFDDGLPLPQVLRRTDGSTIPYSEARVTELNDQHAFLAFPPELAPAPGDLVQLGISHPCTTFDKWRVLPVVRDDSTVVDLIHTFF